MLLKKTKKLFHKFVSFFFAQKKSEYEETLAKIRSTSHRGALCAPHQVTPEFTSQELDEAFRLCTKNT